MIVPASSSTTGGGPVICPAAERTTDFPFAGFVDVGDAWYGTSESLSDLHSDFGLGLRFGVVRSSVASIGRVDLAYSVDADQTDSPRIQLLFGTSLRF